MELTYPIRSRRRRQLPLEPCDAVLFWNYEEIFPNGKHLGG